MVGRHGALLLGLIVAAVGCSPSSEAPRSGAQSDGTSDATSADSRNAVSVREARVAESVNGESMSVYAVLEGGPSGDALVGIRPAIDAAGSLHAMESEGGMMAMRRIERIDVPAHAHVELRPGVVHGMLEELRTVPAVGDTLALTFLFASGAEVEVRAPVLSMAEIATGSHAH